VNKKKRKQQKYGKGEEVSNEKHQRNTTFTEVTRFIGKERGIKRFDKDQHSSGRRE